ncbi:LOW QUALITY PROTEIN: coiled-coil domain-containing protein 170-like [Tupaia chinensis]|uniref:LOW QUALITY PROTEIN: coiled-coil domain-containing protein 170-like n=1 Tax=Tupaia chinensis TaxID=246437 RepID=UPI000703D601|nr:LOW QUALITY PROTEIN: coiled-coil domain-containing protein 170-like [Tupaia chinensis]
MSSPLQLLNHSNPGRLATDQTKEPHEAKPSEVRHLTVHISQENGTALRNLQNKLFMKETSLQEMKTELESYKESNVQQSFQIMALKDDIKDLQELIASLTRIKSLNNTNIHSLERGNWALTERIMELENRLRVHLIEREKAERKADFLEKKLLGANRFFPYLNMKGLEDSLNIFMLKDKSEVIPAKNFERDNIFHIEEPKDGQKIWDKCQQDLIHKEKQTFEFNRPHYPFSWETKTVKAQYQNFLHQLAILLSDSVVPIPATEEAVKERIQEIGANEQSWKSRTESLFFEMLTKRLEHLHHLYEDSDQELSQTEEKYWEQKRPLQCLGGKTAISDILQGRSDLDRKKENARNKNCQTDEHSKKFKQLEKDDMQQMLLSIRQNLQIATTQRLEEKIQKLQKQLSDLKLSNKNMKTQLTRVNVLKDKTIEKLRQSLTKVEIMKDKTVMKTDPWKTTSDSAEHEARTNKERAHEMLDAVRPELPTAKSIPKEVPGREQELVDFRETIMKMLGFNMKTADKEIINQLKLIIQVYEISNKPKIASDSQTGQNNE